MKINLYKKSLILTSILGVVILCGCEGYRCAKGTVCDSDTKEPLDSVLCTVLTGTEVQYSDSIGSFAVCNNLGGCVTGCADIEVEFSKIGYKTMKGTNIEGDKIYLEKE